MDNNIKRRFEKVEETNETILKILMEMNSEDKDRFDNAKRLIEMAGKIKRSKTKNCDHCDAKINDKSDDSIHCELCGKPRKCYSPCNCPRGLAIQVSAISGLPYRINENVGSPTLKWAFQALRKYCLKYNGQHGFIKDAGVQYVSRTPDHAKFGENYFATINHTLMKFGVGEFGKSPAEAICKIIINHNKDFLK